MMKLDVSASGRLKEKYWMEACAEYSKRLSRFCKLTIKETPERIPPSVPNSSYRVALCSEGKMLSSVELANLIIKWQNDSISRICFLIGDSEGLPESYKSGADYRLSLSRMTWPHHMARVMLLEQLYRAYTIIEGGRYHK